VERKILVERPQSQHTGGGRSRDGRGKGRCERKDVSMAGWMGVNRRMVRTKGNKIQGGIGVQ